MKKYFCFVLALVLLLLTSAACGKRPEPDAMEFKFETEAPDSRLPEFKGDIIALMNNYYMEADFAGKTYWAAGLNGNFYLSEPTVAEFSAEWHNIFSKNCTSSFYDYLYEYYIFLKDGTYSVESIDENAAEVIGRKAHKLVLSSKYGNTNSYYLDAEYGFCLKTEDINGKTVFEVKELKIGNVKLNDLKWEKPDAYTGTPSASKKADPTKVVVDNDETTTVNLNIETTTETVNKENVTASGKEETTTVAAKDVTTTAEKK